MVPGGQAGIFTMLACRWKLLPPKHAVHCRLLNAWPYAASQDHQLREEEGAVPPTPDWYRKSYPKLLKMAKALTNVDQGDDGRVFNVHDNSTVRDDRVVEHLRTFKCLARAFIGSPAMRQALLIGSGHSDDDSAPVFGREEERAAMTLDCLTKVCDLLHVSSQQRKAIRLTLCRQITQQHIWRGALLELLHNLRSEMATLERRHWTRSLHMCEQIAAACVKLLVQTSDGGSGESTPLWMQISPPSSRAWNRRRGAAGDEPPEPLSTWKEVLEMFRDLTEWMEKGEEVLGRSHLLMMEAMKEGLCQIKDVAMEREEMGYNEARRQDCIVQRRLSASLGHSSKCLFTLLLYYLYGTVRDVQVDACALYGGGGRETLLCVGKVLTSDDGRTVLAGVKQLDRAIGLFRIVWETASADRVLRTQGHLWCVGAEERTLTYRGTIYSVHTFRL